MQWSCPFAWLMSSIAALGGTGCEHLSGLSDLHGGTETGGGLPAPCSSTSTDSLRDAFDGTQIGSAWKVSTDQAADIQFLETQGELVGTIGTTDTSWQLGAVISAGLYDFTNCSVTARITRVPGGRGAGGLLVMGATEWTARAEFNVDGGRLGFILYDQNQVPTNLPNVDYSAADDLWWRIAEDRGTVLFQTSDGGPFVTRGSGNLPFDPSQVYIAFFAEAAADITDAGGEIHFDDLNRKP